MKRKIISTLFIVCAIMLTACKESVCGECIDVAPEGTEISWTEYNSVAEVCKYFDCHRKTIEEHIGDTFKVSGYFFQPGEKLVDFNTYMNHSMWDTPNDVHSELFFCSYNDSVNHHSNDFLYIWVPQAQVLQLGNYRWGQRVSCTVLMQGESGIYSGCDCCHGVRVRMINIESIEE